MPRLVPMILICAGIYLSASFPKVNAANAAEAQRVEVTARRYSFSPGTVTVKKGEPVILVVRSMDVPHGLRFRELNVEVKVPKGATREIEFTPDKSGDFVGQCSVFCGEGHGNMRFMLHVIG